MVNTPKEIEFDYATKMKDVGRDKHCGKNGQTLSKKFFDPEYIFGTKNIF